ncbi:MAG: trigger factor [Candidatus Dadabacteria bacterium]|nr:MAG: trigger factor [Candidatus Dadabacteria bacterium]
MEYKSAVKDLDNQRKELSVTIPEHVVREAFDVRLARVGKNASVKGFRPGKAPKEVLKNVFGKKVMREVREDLIGTSFSESVKEHDIRYVGYPTLSMESGEDETEIRYKVSMDIYPEPELGKYKGFEVEIPKIEISDEDVTSVIEDLLEQRAQFREVNSREVVGENDAARCIVQLVDDKSEPLGEASEVIIFPGKNDSQAHEKIRGMKKDEEKVIEWTSGDGSKSLVKVKVKAVGDKIVPELDDSVAQDIFPKEQNVKTALDVRLHVRKLLEEDAKRRENAMIEGAVLMALVNAHEFDVPQVMVDSEIYNMFVRNGYIKSEELPFEKFNPEPFREEFGEDATNRAKASVLIDLIAEKEGLLSSSDALNSWLDGLRKRLGDEKAERLFKNRDLVSQMWQEHCRSEVLKMLVEKAKVKYVDPQKADDSKKAGKGGKKGKSSGKAKESRLKKGSQKKKKVNSEKKDGTKG